jgi:alkylmercury lyase
MGEMDLGFLAAAVCKRLAQVCCGEGNRRLAESLIRLLSQGEPVTPERLATHLRRPLAEVSRMLEDIPDLERDDCGRIVAGGISLLPTAHRFIVDGRVLFTWCALDALSYPTILGRTVSIESYCHASRAPLRLVVTPAALELADPAEMVVSLGSSSSPLGAGSLRARFCDRVRFFRSPAAGEGWLADHPDGVLLPVGEAFQLGSRLAAPGGCARGGKATAIR